MNIPPLRTVGLLILCIAVPLLIGMVGSFYTTPEIPTWYASLNKPPFTPPGWVFGPVWTTLYILMGISLFLVVRNGLGAAPVRQGVLLYSAQLALNLFWSVLFFGMHAVFLGLLDIILLFVLIAATTALFLRISRPAAWLLIPYLCWVGFASLVNAMTWILNR
jgi:tryptophan-rich sensory protein